MTTPKKPAEPASQAAPAVAPVMANSVPARPAKGGSYVRQADGRLVKKED